MNEITIFKAIRDAFGTEPGSVVLEYLKDITSHTSYNPDTNLQYYRDGQRNLVEGLIKIANMDEKELALLEKKSEVGEVNDPLIKDLFFDEQTGDL